MKKVTYPIIPLVLVVLLLAACGPQATQPGNEEPATTESPSSPASPTEPPIEVDSQLSGTRWILTSYLNESGSMIPVVPGSRITAEFSNGQVGGSAGCNSYSGPYKLDGKGLSIGQLASTMMACDEPLMQQESAFLAALGKTASYQIVDGQLSLLDAHGAVVSVFKYS